MFLGISLQNLVEMTKVKNMANSNHISKQTAKQFVILKKLG